MCIMFSNYIPGQRETKTCKTYSSEDFRSLFTNSFYRITKTKSTLTTTTASLRKFPDIFFNWIAIYWRFQCDTILEEVSNCVHSISLQTMYFFSSNITKALKSHWFRSILHVFDNTCKLNLKILLNDTKA